MKEIDFLALDGKSLRTFLAVLDESSISKAAERLGVTQSAVSHTLDKLRLALGDPLFVRLGRNIVATEKALALRESVQSVLDDLKGLTNQRVFDPLIGKMDFTIAANDLQRDLIFPSLLKDLLNEGVDTHFRFIPSGIPATELLRQDRCQLIITPFPPKGVDIFQTRLFDDQMVCFYDASMRKAPKSIKEYLEADYIEIRFSDKEVASFFLSQKKPLQLSKPRITVPDFRDLAVFLKDSEMITTNASLCGKDILKDFESVSLPFKTDDLTMYMVWHRRDHLDPAHQWFRNRIKSQVEVILNQSIRSVTPPQRDN